MCTGTRTYITKYNNFHDFLFPKNWKIPFPITEEDSET
jgi:hypothetical protein